MTHVQPLEKARSTTEAPSPQSKWFAINGPLKNPEAYVPILEQYAEAWNTANLDLVLECFSEDIRYRDNATRRWLDGIPDLKKYVARVFNFFPSQRWEAIEFYPHAEEGEFSVWYRFEMSGPRAVMVGEGYERITVRDRKICFDDVFLRVEAMPIKLPFLTRPCDVFAFAKSTEYRLARWFAPK